MSTGISSVHLRACKPWAETGYALLRPEVLFLCLAKDVSLISRLPSEGHNKFIKRSDDEWSRTKTVWIGADAVTEGRTKKKKGRKLFDSWCVGKKYGNWSERMNTCTLSTVHVVIRFIRGKHRASNKNCYCNGSLQFMIIFSRNVVVNITIKIHTY